MKQFFVLAAIWLALLPATAGELVIRGAGPPTRLLQALASEFNARAALPQGAQRVEVPPSTGMAGALAAARAGAPLARLPRRLTADEQREGLHQTVIASELIVFATGADVSVDNVSRAQLAAVFSGRLTDWSELGGKPGPIRVFYRDDNESALRVIRKRLPEFERLAFGSNARLLNLDHEVIEHLERFGWGVGWGSAGNVRAANGLRVLALDGVAPDADALRAGRYPLYYELVLIHPAEALTGAAREFVEFIFSPAGRAVIAAFGALPAPGP